MKLAGKVAMSREAEPASALESHVFSRVMAQRLSVAQIDTSRCPFTDSEMRDGGVTMYQVDVADRRQVDRMVEG